MRPRASLLHTAPPSPARVRTAAIVTLAAWLVGLAGCASIPGKTGQEQAVSIEELETKTLADVQKLHPNTTEELAAAAGYVIMNNKLTKIPLVGVGGGYGVGVDKRTGERTYLKMSRFDIGAGWGETVAAGHEELPDFKRTRVEDTTSITFLLPELERFQQTEDFFVKVKSSRSLDGIVLENGFGPDDARLAGEALKSVLDMDVLETGFVVAMRGFRESAAQPGFRLAQVSVYADQTYLGTVARDDEGAQMTEVHCGRLCQIGIDIVPEMYWTTGPGAAMV